MNSMFLILLSISLFLNGDLVNCLKNDEELLISSNALYDLLKQDDFDKNYRIIETNFGLDPKSDYNKGHIPKAIYVDVTYNSSSTQYIQYNIPQAKTLGAFYGSLGISDHHRIIIYDRSSYGFSASSRLWFLMNLFGNENVTVLNGGLNDWNGNKFPLSTDTPSFGTESYEAVFQPKLLRLYEEVLDAVKAGTEVMVDARDPPVYEQAHIPTAFNVPYADLFDPITGLLKTKDELLKMVTKEGVDLNRILVTYCQTGIRASTLKLVLNYIGAQNVAVYNGSWFEYSQRSQLMGFFQKLARYIKSFF